MRWLVILLSSFITFNTAFAIDEVNKEKIKAKIQKAIPEIKIDEITASPVGGFYEISSAGKIYYVDATGQYFFFGQIFDLNMDRDSWNLTQQAAIKARNSFNSTRKEMIDAIPQSEMIIYKPENTKAIVTAFVDVDCGFCRRLHQEIPALLEKGIEMRFLSFPRAGIDSPTYKKHVSVWCADDPAAALDAASNGQAVPEKTCENTVAKQYQVGIDIGVSGTPSLVFEDGTLWPGYLPADKLAEKAIEHSVSNNGDTEVTETTVTETVSE